MPHNGIFVAIETLFFIRRRRSLSSHRILNASHPQNSLHFAIFRTLYEYHTRWKYMICIMSNGENVHWLQLNELSLTHAHQFIYDDRTSRLQIQCRTEIFAWCNGSLSLPFILWISLTQRNNRMTSLRSAFHKCSHVNVANNRAKERRIKRSGGKWSSLFVYVIFFFRKSSQNTKLISIPIFTSFLPFLPLCRNVLSTPPRHGWCLSVKETPALVLWTNINQTKPKSNQMNFCRNHLLIEIYCDLNLIADGRKQNTHTHTHYPNWPIDEKTWI